jgi:hypothetical protein
LEIDSRGDGSQVDSVVTKERCFGRMFGKDCSCT